MHVEEEADEVAAEPDGELAAIARIEEGTTDERA